MGNRHLAPDLLACRIAACYRTRCLAGPPGFGRHWTIALESLLLVCRPRERLGWLAGVVSNLASRDTWRADSWNHLFFLTPAPKCETVTNCGLQGHTVSRFLGPTFFFFSDTRSKMRDRRQIWSREGPNQAGSRPETPFGSHLRRSKLFSPFGSRRQGMVCVGLGWAGTVAWWHGLGLSLSTPRKKRTVRKSEAIMDVQTANGFVEASTKAKVHITEMDVDLLCG